jgi:uncharacterized protein (DUF58 family)
VKAVQPSPAASAFTTEAVAAAQELHLTAQKVAQGLFSGLHRSARRGASVEFSEHKVYVPGDEVRHIDWRAYAKTDRYHIKQYEDETNLQVHLLLDTSASMAFASAPAPSKLQVAKVAAAALATVALRQGDAVALQILSSAHQETLPPRHHGSHWADLLRVLTATQASGQTTLTQALQAFAQTQRRPAVVVVLSDLFDAHPDLLQSFATLAARRHEVKILQVLAAQEVSFDFPTPANFVSLEDPRSLFIEPLAVRDAYTQRMQDFLQGLQDVFSRRRMPYQCVLTHQALGPALAALLRRHEAGSFKR